MVKKTRKKRKISPIKKSLRKRNLARNFIVLLALIFLLLLFAYFFLSKNNQTVKSSSNNNILQSEKLYTNDEIMEEIIQNLNPDIKNNILEKDLDEDLDEEKTKKESFEEELKKDISKEVFERQKEIEKSKIEQKIETKQSKEIEDEIIEEKSQIEKPITKQKKDLITKKDNYKYDLKTKPKLVIIIDDVVSKTQKDKILNIGYPITMAFLPPNNGHKESAIIAQNLPFHMIHFPMQASKNFKNIEVNTLNISDSYETIEARVKQLRVLYPNATYTNNHTGSVFTENYEAMDKLFRALKKYNFIFVDSRTTPNSVAKELSIKYQMPYIVRDTFLDNDRSFTAIQNQLKDAIRVAKKQGFAIAIGHPYEVTFQVLKESKHLLNDVEPIFLNKLPYL
ncbi:divergent polysaccharide deacetylase family protein [Aliarcobacter cryaerophilus]|uniref:divergent polysaccharide deacetylase family protein n=1 Tax=Aliarcobacter cryaerophilus TaxID=28198 RepID=UPI00112F25DE|nr:divergent polysaccharide deacetylase family protein [Aliarcobacter cryaerophilus]